MHVSVRRDPNDAGIHLVGRSNLQFLKLHSVATLKMPPNPSVKRYISGRKVR